MKSLPSSWSLFFCRIFFFLPGSGENKGTHHNSPCKFFCSIAIYRRTKIPRMHGHPASTAILLVQVCPCSDLTSRAPCSPLVLQCHHWNPATPFPLCPYYPWTIANVLLHKTREIQGFPVSEAQEQTECHGWYCCSSNCGRLIFHSLVTIIHCRSPHSTDSVASRGFHFHWCWVRYSHVFSTQEKRGVKKSGPGGERRPLLL